MSEKCNIDHPLKREGTYQWQRLQEGLKKAFFKPDDRSIEQMVMQVAEYASLVKYYDQNVNELGNWEAFFEYMYDYQNNKLKVQNIDSLLTGDVPAHLGLLLSFLKIFEAAKDELNRFTARHVDFYYTDVLQLSAAKAVADKVAVIFEPEKNAAVARVSRGTELSAGKDATKKDLVYKTTREIIVNQIAISQKKSIWADKDETGKIKSLHIAKDALGENKFIQNNITSWYPFGTVKNPAADIGFALSSPMLLAKEGRRRFSIEIEGGEAIPRTSLVAYYTGPKGWVQAEVDTQPGTTIGPVKKSNRYLLIKIDESLPAISVYDEKIHKSNLSCVYPVLKLLLKPDSTFSQAYLFFSSLRLSDVKKIVMNVEGVKSFSLAGDTGNLNPLQSFRPFGTSPVKNKSFFTIGSTEAFNKYLTTFHLAINWKGVPGNLFKYYSSYDDFLLRKGIRTKAGDQVVRGTDGKKTTEAYSDFRAPFLTFNQGNVPGKTEVLSGGKWVSVREDSPNQYLSRNPATYNTYHASNTIKDDFDLANKNDYSSASKSGFARVTLAYDFGHSYFAAVLSDTILQNTKISDPAKFKVIPNHPYTPEFNSLHLDYVLEDTVHASTISEHQFIQLHPFGFNKISSPQQNLVAPDFHFNGQLYLGLSNCNAGQIVNLFIGRLDGTEDINAAVNEKADIFYLKGSEWIKFKFEEVVVDTTKGFTSSGFLSLSIPANATSPNTVMGENLVWIKIASLTSGAAYPSIINIHTNAVEATFDNRGNDKYHLQTPLKSGTITKPVIKIDGVKSISQPYSSYEGRMEEQEEQFNTRVSERLRHKSRSWSIWDYEHLVLEKFPAIYKMKCISHASKNDMYVPGNVLCVVVPSTANVAEKDILRPGFSKAVLAEAKEYISRFKTEFAKVDFINPVYETITIKCSVKIRNGFDENFYGNQLNKDLQQFISPWIKDKNASPSFGGRIYASTIINFIEELEYIDYLTFFSATKVEDGKIVSWTEFATGSSEDVILTSAAQHEIDTKAIC